MTTPENSIWPGLIFTAVGLGMMALVTFDREGLHAPLWVAQAACGCFALAEAALLARSFGWKRLANAFGLGVVYCMIVPPVWIAFGGGERSCTASGAGFLRIAGDFQCRGAFGVSAGLTLFCAIALTWAVLKGRATMQG